MPQERLIPPPSWTSIFTVHDGLTPPGYAETFLDMLENPKERPARGKPRGKGKEARWTSIKHAKDV